MAYDPITGMFTEDKPKSNFTYGSGNPLTRMCMYSQQDQTLHPVAMFQNLGTSGSITW
jgi:hypothetical protein